MLMGSLYLVLTLGAFTMVYPFMLMITTAMTANPSGQIRLFAITIFCLHWRPND